MTAPLYRVWAKFEPHHVNPLTGRRGQWRVVASYRTNIIDSTLVRNGYLPEIGALSTRNYRRGTIIRPHKELNRVLAAREQGTQ